MIYFSLSQWCKCRYAIRIMARWLWSFLSVFQAFFLQFSQLWQRQELFSDDPWSKLSLDFRIILPLLAALVTSPPFPCHPPILGQSQCDLKEDVDDHIQNLTEEKNLSRNLTRWEAPLTEEPGCHHLLQVDAGVVTGKWEKQGTDTQVFNTGCVTRAHGWDLCLLCCFCCCLKFKLTYFQNHFIPPSPLGSPWQILGVTPSLSLQEEFLPFCEPPCSRND